MEWLQRSVPVAAKARGAPCQGRRAGHAMRRGFPTSRATREVWRCRVFVRLPRFPPDADRPCASTHPCSACPWGYPWRRPGPAGTGEGQRWRFGRQKLWKTDVRQAARAGTHPFHKRAASSIRRPYLEEELDALDGGDHGLGDAAGHCARGGGRTARSREDVDRCSLPRRNRQTEQEDTLSAMRAPGELTAACGEVLHEGEGVSCLLGHGDLDSGENEVPLTRCQALVRQSLVLQSLFAPDGSSAPQGPPMRGASGQAWWRDKPSRST